MTLHQTVLVALLCGSACADVEQPRDGGPRPGDQAQGVTAAQLAVRSSDVCDLLPPDGACRLACDEAALAAHVPPGTCAVFRCELLDGSVISVHACHD